MAEETITPLMSNDLAGVSGKEVLMYTVDFPPGFSSPVHRHNAQVSLYVLEGSVVMQVKGGKEITLRPGKTFYESPNDIHVVSRNASSACVRSQGTSELRRLHRGGRGLGSRKLRKIPVQRR